LLIVTRKACSKSNGGVGTLCWSYLNGCTIARVVRSKPALEALQKMSLKYA
jgi:hypothetical protein